MPGPISESMDRASREGEANRLGWLKQIDSSGQRYFVVKAREFIEALDGEQVAEFAEMLDTYNAARAERGKRTNWYWVCNQDEPYADETIALILKNEGVNHA